MTSSSSENALLDAMPVTPIAISLIVPSYNQAARLALFLSSLGDLRVDLPWEVVVADDGSSDLTPAVLTSFATRLPLRVVTLARNGGRARARNVAAEASAGQLLIFCDGDRLCDPAFVQAHNDAHFREPAGAVTGDIRELYITAVDRMADDEITGHPRLPLSEWQDRSRRTSFVQALYEYMAADPEPCASWLSFLSGNVSVPRALFFAAGGFEESFDSWGYEHLELGYRLAQHGAAFSVDLAAVNYHLAHARPVGFYGAGIRRSVDIVRRLHPELPIDVIASLSRSETTFTAAAAALQAVAAGPNT